MRTPKLPPYHQADVLILGDAMLDQYVYGQTTRISPEAPVPVVEVNATEKRAGGAGNVAMNIAALGGDVSLISAVGHDDNALILKELLTASHINCLFHATNIPTSTKLRVLSAHQQLIRLDTEEVHWHLPEQGLLELFQQALSNKKLVILSDYAKGTLTDAKPYIRLAKQAGIPVLIDPKQLDYHLYQGADIITPNRREFEAVVGPCHTQKDLQTKAQNLLKRFQIKTLVITLGEEGLALITPTDMQILPAQTREVFDVTGAGDTVIATIGAGLAAGQSLLEAAYTANIAASIAISKVGTAKVLLSELAKALESKHQQDAHSGQVTTPTALRTITEELKQQRKTIVFTNGCFDILHPGHVTYLQEAKALGDILIVAVNVDATVSKLKGPKRPINPLHHRMTMLAALASVDYVIPFAEETPAELIEFLKPNILVKGGDYKDILALPGAAFVLNQGGQVKILSLVPNCSTSNIIDKIEGSITVQP